MHTHIIFSPLLAGLLAVTLSTVSVASAPLPRLSDALGGEDFPPSGQYINPFHTAPVRLITPPPVTEATYNDNAFSFSDQGIPNGIAANDLLDFTFSQCYQTLVEPPMQQIDQVQRDSIERLIYIGREDYKKIAAHFDPQAPLRAFLILHEAAHAHPVQDALHVQPDNENLKQHFEAVSDVAALMLLARTADPVSLSRFTEQLIRYRLNQDKVHSTALPLVVFRSHYERNSDLYTGTPQAELVALANRLVTWVNDQNFGSQIEAVTALEGIQSPVARSLQALLHQNQSTGSNDNRLRIALLILSLDSRRITWPEPIIERY